MRLTAALIISAAALALAGVADAQMEHNTEHIPQGNPSFSAQMMRAMQEMDTGMMAARPTHDPDLDFAGMMIPHHQGAVDMAKLEILYGRDPVLRRLAQGIIVEQKQEIELMQRRLVELSRTKP